MRDHAGRRLGEADRVQERLDGRPHRSRVSPHGGLGEGAGYLVVPRTLVIQKGDQGRKAQLHEVLRHQPG